MAAASEVKRYKKNGKKQTTTKKQLMQYMQFIEHLLMFMEQPTGVKSVNKF